MAAGDLDVRSWDPRFRDDFARLNLEWLAQGFTVEAHDRELFDDPEGRIVSGGGDVLFALRDGRPIGTVALVNHGDGVFELCKMAVTTAERGAGIGRRLLAAALARAVGLGAGRVWLESHTSLAAALKLYRSAGFRAAERPVASQYRRCDVYLEWTPPRKA